jgi:AhpD family alkylhydroperoxidase
MNTQTEELIAIAASVTANCIPCVQYHEAKTRGCGVPDEEIAQAIRIAKRVRKGAGGKMDEALASTTAASASAPVQEAGACGCA